MSLRADGGLTFDDHLQGAMTMKLTASMMVTVDGVYQGPGGPDEDRRGGFDRGGWTAAHADDAMWPFLTSWFERADALLLGRKTWEIWEPYWRITTAAIRSRTASTSCPSMSPRPRSR